MAPDLGLFLGVMSIAQSGDPVGGKWSIGGSFTPALPIFKATGIAGTHNHFEGDASFTKVYLLPRPGQYPTNMDRVMLTSTKVRSVFSRCGPGRRCTSELSHSHWTMLLHRVTTTPGGAS
jgi:hypothetical protein